jgi:hypothetical protein
MTKYFDVLTETEYTQLKEAIPLIAILIAGADGNIDAKEKEWTLKVAKIRTYKGPKILRHYYSDIAEDIEEKLHDLSVNLHLDQETRESEILEKLLKVNDILAKLDQFTGASLYNSFISYAEHIAKASGGFLRMWSVSKAESRLMNLPMLTPIEMPETDEEE